MELQGAGAIVTGGASGIGAACVTRLRKAGARVAVLDLVDAPDADVSERVDVADESQVVTGVARAVNELGRLDVAVLSAGVGGSAPLLELTTAEWDRVMNVNLRGAFVCLRECGRAMTNGGSIVAVTSVSGFLADRSMAHYGASKAALAQLVRSAARELGAQGIRVNAVAPGTTDTPMFAPTDRLPGYRTRVTQRAALGRLGTADEVAQAVVALCTLDWVTGQILAADGGVSLHSPIDPWESLGP
jgi:NAD(P)-dependent dehydrogenase (short-subunit alcohol dehydrogenase family)